MDLDKFFQETDFSEAEKAAEKKVEENAAQPEIEDDGECGGGGCKI